MLFKSKAPVSSAGVIIRTTDSFSEVAVIETDAKGNKLEHIVTKDGRVMVRLTTADLNIDIDRYDAGTPEATKRIKRVDEVLAANDKRVTRFLLTQPHLKAEMA